MTRKTVFYISTRFPWPKTAGRDHMIQQSIKALSKDNSIHYVLLSSNSHLESLPTGVDFIHHIKRPKLWIIFVNIIAFRVSCLQEALFFSSDNLRVLRRLADLYEPDLVVFDMVRTTAYDSAFKSSVLVCDMDDLLSRRYLQIVNAGGNQGSIFGTYVTSSIFRFLDAVASPVKRGVYFIEKILIERREDQIARRYGAVMLVSKREVADLIERSRSSRVIFDAPPTIALPSNYGGARGGSDRKLTSIIFVGDMRTHANIQAVQYILAELVPEFMKIGIEFEYSFIGKADSELSDRIARTSNCSYVGWVDDIDLAYRDADYVICPFVVGTGIKVKVLEAMAYGKPVLTNVLGIDGTQISAGVEAVICQTPADFGTELRRLMSDVAAREALGRAARALIEREYNPVRVEARIAQKIQDIIMDVVE